MSADLLTVHHAIYIGVGLAFGVLTSHTAAPREPWEYDEKLTEDLIKIFTCSIPLNKLESLISFSNTSIL